MNKKSKSTELSYYGLYLLNYLNESLPDKTYDTTFIEDRADRAAGVYQESLREGYPSFGAQELAMVALLEGLHFSKYDTLTDVLENEFAGEVPQDGAAPFARKLLPLLENIFSGYTLTDDFAQSSEYDLLYTELTGAVALYIEEAYGI